MQGWLIVNGFLKSKKFDELFQMFLDVAKENNVVLEVVSNDSILVGSKLNDKPDFVIFWDKDILLAKYLENLGIAVYNSASFISACDDKRKTFIALEQANIPVPKTILAPMTYQKDQFENYDFLYEMEKELEYPIIVKEAYGSFGEQVYKVDNHDKLLKLLDSLETTEILFQEYVETSCGKDIRIQVVGNEVCCSMLRTSQSDFRANITAGGTMQAYEPDQEAMQLAIRCVKELDGDFAGVDLLFGEQGYLICEVNSNAHFKNLYDCTGVNTADAIIKYIIKKENYEK